MLNFRYIILLFPYVIIFIFFIIYIYKNIQIKKRHYKHFKFLHNYLNSIISARYGNLNCKIDEGIDNLTKQLSKNTNAFFESVIDRDKMIQENIEREKERQNLKQDFISGLAHDLKVPIIAQDNTFDLFLAEKFGKLTNEQKTAIQNLKISNDNLKKLVLNLLDVQKYENSSLVLNKTKTELNSLINDVLEQNKSILEIQNKKVVFSSDTSKVFCILDEFFIRRVLNNLLANAIAYSKNSREIYINLKNNDKTVELSIKDNGCGINEEEINKIFEKYYTSSKKYSNTSTGLGLYISNRIIKAHGGSIFANNNADGGATFTVMLPM